MMEFGGLEPRAVVVDSVGSLVFIIEYNMMV